MDLSAQQARASAAARLCRRPLPDHLHSSQKSALMPHLLTDPAVVDLFWNKIGDSGAELLGEALASSSTLTALGLYYSGITAGGAAHIAQGVGRSRSLSTLDLTRNQIGDSGAEALGRALAVLSWDFGRDTACHGLRPAVTDANHGPREAGVKCVLYQ